jgi:hypothetical protein
VAASAALASVASGAYAHNDGFNERIVACFDSHDPNSDECLSALDVSPVDAGFFDQLAANLRDRPRPTPEPKKAPKADLYGLMKACAETGDLASDECQRALDKSGLSTEDFIAKISAKFDVDLSGDASEETDAMTTCRELRASINGRSVHELAGIAEKVNVACGRAFRESHMSAREFWMKYR